ncbi:MAG: S9 family peptidase, partial [Pseudoxanthomonas sp.]|nr:S9 family peptidase [Pseudoxanthomonas sp.]
MKVIASIFLAAALLASSVPLAAQVDVERYIKQDAFGEIKLSPDGDYYAASVPMENQTVLAIMRRSDNKLTTTFSLGKNTHVMDFWWVNPERVVISAGEKFGELDLPLPTG